MNHVHCWRVQTVDELCSVVTSGGTPTRSCPGYYEGGRIPWIKTGELRDGFIHDSQEHITADAVSDSSAKILPTNTVLMAMYGATVGALGVLARPAACNQAACAMIADPSVCDSRWLFYALLNDRDRIVLRATGAAQQNLSGQAIRQFSYLTPPLAEQKAIAEVLGALDDKIAANSRTLLLLEKLGYAEWQRASSTSQRTRPLSDFATLQYGRSLPEPQRNSGAIPVYGSGGKVGWHNEALVESPGIVIGRKGSVGTVHWAPGPHYAIDTTYFVGVKEGILPEYLYFALKWIGLHDMNSDSAVPGLNRSEAYRRPVPVPSPSAVERFTEVVPPFFVLEEHLQRENASATVLRDTLLPLLMSGKIRVKDAEEVVQGVV